MPALFRLRPKVAKIVRVAGLLMGLASDVDAGTLQGPNLERVVRHQTNLGDAEEP
jgi:hypothetical protein